MIYVGLWERLLILGLAAAEEFIFGGLGARCAAVVLAAGLAIYQSKRERC